MRVERGEHAVDRGLDQLFGVDRLDILGADAFEDVAEQVELFIDRLSLAAPLAAISGPATCVSSAPPRRGATRGGQGKFLHPASVSCRGSAANHSVGSTGAAPSLSSK
jgi:hypothetical protein